MVKTYKEQTIFQRHFDEVIMTTADIKNLWQRAVFFNADRVKKRRHISVFVYIILC